MFLTLELLVAPSSYCCLFPRVYTLYMGRSYVQHSSRTRRLQQTQAIELSRCYVLILAFSLISMASYENIKNGEGRVKMPLSPVARAQKRSFGGDIHIAESVLYALSSSSGSSITHGISSSDFGHMQFDTALYPAPHRSQILYALSSSSGSSITHGISSINFGQMPFDTALYPAPHRSQMRLQSTRSHSREDLSSSLSDPTHK